MAQNTILGQRFADLDQQLEKVEATKRHVEGRMISGLYVDDDLFTNWKLKSLNLLGLACGENSIHYKTFVERQNNTGYSTNYQVMNKLKAIFDAAREDFEGGYLNSVRNIIEAEVFSTELDQANELLKSGYIVAAAVIAGVVLETTMRRMCVDRDIEPGSLNKMNADLMKAGAYTVLTNKRITTLADIRNSAAHGHPEKFTRDDVADMIAKVEAFVTDQLG